MDREQTKKALPILQAFAEGKIIQWTDPDDYHSEWIDMSADELEEYQILNYPEDYRIKPMPKCRPFVNIEECWQEMQKHQPFGWVIRNNVRKIIVAEVLSDGVVLHNQSGSYYDFEEANRILTFVDGTVFGIKEE